MNSSNPEVDRPEKQTQLRASNNVVYVVDGSLGLEAIENKILILVDKFKSGYECKDCGGTGIYEACECEKRNSFGVKENGKTCSFRDNCAKQRKGATCLTCRGTGSTVIVPESARALPTSGIIVSRGPLCNTRNLGERVLFGAHTGYYIPFKGNAKIRCMREDEPLCLLYANEKQVTLGDFVQIEDTEY